MASYGELVVLAADVEHGVEDHGIQILHDEALVGLLELLDVLQLRRVEERDPLLGLAVELHHLVLAVHHLPRGGQGQTMSRKHITYMHRLRST